MKSIQTIYADWQEGDITDQQALEILVKQLAAVEDSLVPLEETKKVLRSHISEVVEHQGGNVELPGYGKFAIRNATITKSYDSKELDALVMDLVKQGLGDVAQAVANCKKESARTGGLVITKEKENKGK
jgi:hypothetical protein